MILRAIPTIGAVRPANLEQNGRTVICRVARGDQPDWGGEWLVRYNSGSFATVTDYGAQRPVDQDAAARVARDQAAMTPDEFKAARKSLGLTQAQLGHVMDTSPQTIRRWEMPTDRSTARGVNPVAARVMRWMLDGFRPPEIPKG